MADTKRKSLKERAEELTVRLPIMNDRDKGEMDDLHGKIVTLRDYDFLSGLVDKKTKAVKPPFAVFVIDEDPVNFYFGGMVLTDKLKKLTEEGYAEEIKADGLPVLFSKVRSKDGNVYTNVELYPVQPTAEDVLDKAMGAKRK